MKYLALENKNKYGNKRILDKSGNQIGELIDFCRWVHSDIVENTERSVLAEYFVAKALGVVKYKDIYTRIIELVG